jgi:hypothetical protein
MNTLHFNDADLKANREGRLSDAQQKRLDVTIQIIKRDQKSDLWFMMMLAGSIVAAGLIIFFHDKSQNMETATLLADLTVYARVSLIFIVGIGLVALYRWGHVRRLTQPEIRVIEGRADTASGFVMTKGFGNNRWFEPARRVPLNKLELQRPGYGAFTFQFSDKASLRYFKNGKRYRIYYLLMGDPYLLSAEKLEPEKTKTQGFDL